MTVSALVITHSRFEGLKNVVKSCLRADVKHIYVAIDGPRDARTAEIQSQMRDYLSELSDSKRVSISVWQRPENLGIAVSVITAIDWFFKHETEGVILEDDLSFEESFIKFSSLALSFFSENEQIQIISGNRYDGNSTREPILVSYPQTWGWATWRNKWMQIRRDINHFPTEGIKLSNSSVWNFWQAGSTRVWQGFVDTWDLLVAYSMIRQGKFCLLPPVNLVSNVGNDSYSTHTNDDSFPIDFPIAAIDAKLIDFSKIRLSPDKKANKFLEKRVFRIKRRHKLLGQYLWLANSRIPRKYKNGSFISRLDSVLIP